MSENSFNSRLLEAIMKKDKLEKIKKEIFEKEISIPFELLKLGYNYSIWVHREPRIYDKRADWIHIATYCKDPKVEQFIEEVFFSEIRFKGDCLIALWFKNPKKAHYWLDLVHEYDPLFSTLSFHKTKLVEKLQSDFKCQGTELFTRIYLSDEEKKGKILDKDVLRVLTTEVKLREQFGEITGRNSREYSSSLHEIQNQRDLLISSNSLSESHADRIFNSLWEDNISFDNPETEISQRTPQKIFVGYRDEDSGWGFRYGIEARQLLKLLPILSKASLEKIEKLFDHLPFWMNLYRSLESALFKFKPDKVINTWKSVLKIDLAMGDKRNSWVIGSGNERTQPKIDDLLFGLERIRELKDKELLISMINHYNGKIREKVQELLKEAM